MKKLIIAFIAIPLVFWGIPMAVCETQTYLHGSEFDGLQGQTRMIGDVDYWKVMSYSSESATVYYVKEDGGGSTVAFSKQGDAWVLDRWDTIWSRTGSADDFIWPYFYHSPEGLALYVFFLIPLYLLAFGILFIVSVVRKNRLHRLR